MFQQPMLERPVLQHHQKYHMAHQSSMQMQLVPLPLQSPEAGAGEVINRIVEQIRQNRKSVMETEASMQTPSILPLQLIKIQHYEVDKGEEDKDEEGKEEEDIDEDARFLASDEGKKLSSRERRQIRNKVSARNFRSRRKEYITQLENDAVAKNIECHELRLQNQALLEERARSRAFIQRLLHYQAATGVSLW